MQQVNRAYINQSLSGTLEQMMIATLNQMPDDPCLFMRDWLKFHFGNESVNTMEVEEKKEQPKPVGRADLLALREEVGKLKS